MHRRRDEPLEFTLSLTADRTLRDGALSSAISRGYSLSAWLRQAAEEKLEREAPVDEAPDPDDARNHRS